ncbi:RNA-directed DNA polymerase, eukaryota, reverse transcriptase zinc-binding domain protein, partial [Tanacetum coccineum]
KNSENDKGKTKENTNKNFEEEFPPLRAQDKQSNNKEKVVKSNNRFSALRRINEDNPQDISMLKDKILVDKYLNLKVQPSSSEIKNWSQEMINGGCRIVIRWNPDVVNLVVINTSRQHMLCLIESIHNHKKIYCSFVYASNFGMERRGLWKELLMAKICTSGNPWVLMGDFNVTLNVSEHSTGKSTIDGDMEDFLECVNNIEMEDVCSTRIVSPFLTSDHSPAVMIIPLAIEKKKKSFKFANFVADKEDYIPVVENGWNLEIQGCHMFKLVKKLRMLKVSLNKLHWKDGNDFDNVVKLRDKLKATQIEINEDPYDKGKKAVISQILSKYNDVVDDEVKLLYQMEKIDWLNDGDMNSAYFHKVVRSKKVVDEFVNHFEVFLGQLTPVKSIDGIGNIFTSKLTSKEASYMIRENVTGTDVCMAVKEFFSNGKLLKDVNATQIVLIPKVNDACNVTDYRPTACCNGKSIQDNILLTWDLLKGYNRKDDLLVLCHGDAESVKVIKDALNDFSNISGLKPNMSKSIIFFRNVDIGEKNRILEMIPFQVGRFPMRYLGVPLITKRLGKEHCKQLIDKVKAKNIAAKKDTLWVQWIHMVKLRKKSMWEVTAETNDSWIWKCLLGLETKPESISSLRLGMARIYDQNAKVADMIENGLWKWRNE